MKNIIFLILGVIFGIAALQIPALQSLVGSSLAPKMLIEKESPLGFDETLTALETKAKAIGWKVPSKWKVDFQKNLKHVTGVDVGKNQVLKMCEPDAAARLLVHDEYKVLTTMMPCTIAVYEKSDGKTYISIMNMEILGLLYGGEVAEIARELAPQMSEMIELAD